MSWIIAPLSRSLISLLAHHRFQYIQLVSMHDRSSSVTELELRTCVISSLAIVVFEYQIQTKIEHVVIVSIFWHMFYKICSTEFVTLK
uniref:Uncharacterized protein n=1 Tax=Pararge aegeria TaxID=116150 RepID=S4NZD9_9NEOP